MMTIASTFTGVLLTVFVTLKLTHLIAWAWLWVLAPLWIPIVLVIVFYAFIGVILSKVL